MKILRSITALMKVLEKERCMKKKIGFVPTMGYFHEGHLSLMRKARTENDIVVVSIYVNPTQFGPKEDLRSYPRDVKHDTQKARLEKVDYLFCPSDEVMYPDGYGTFIINETISDILCGASRPGHFRGVATIVCKLLNIVGADTAYFGQKDYQQLCVIKRLVSDLNIRTKIKMCPIIREKDGLAMSSRNNYLNTKDRTRAVVLSQALSAARLLVRKGERDPHTIIKKMKQIVKTSVDTIDYIALLDAGNLKQIDEIKGKVYIGVAAYIGATRLIDNLLIQG